MHRWYRSRPLAASVHRPLGPSAATLCTPRLRDLSPGKRPVGVAADHISPSPASPEFGHAAMTEPLASAPGQLARRLVRSGSKVALATSLTADRMRPHSSLALAASTMEGEPLLLLSDLAVHTQNLAADPRIAVLYDADDGGNEPLSGNRVCLMGTAVAEPRRIVGERFLRRYPHARRYAALADFKLYRVQVEAAHLVAGFGAIHWLSAEEMVVPDDTGHAEAEPQVLEALNTDHQPWTLPGSTSPRTEWTLVGIDAEGADFRSEGRFERFSFTNPLENLQQADHQLRHLGRSG